MNPSCPLTNHQGDLNVSPRSISRPGSHAASESWSVWARRENLWGGEGTGCAKDAKDATKNTHLVWWYQKKTWSNEQLRYQMINDQWANWFHEDLLLRYQCGLFGIFSEILGVDFRLTEFVDSSGAIFFVLVVSSFCQSVVTFDAFYFHHSYYCLSSYLHISHNICVPCGRQMQKKHCEQQLKVCVQQRNMFCVIFVCVKTKTCYMFLFLKCFWLWVKVKPVHLSPFTSFFHFPNRAMSHEPSLYLGSPKTTVCFATTGGWVWWGLDLTLEQWKNCSPSLFTDYIVDSTQLYGDHIKKLSGIPIYQPVFQWKVRNHRFLTGPCLTWGLVQLPDTRGHVWHLKAGLLGILQLFLCEEICEKNGN